MKEISVIVTTYNTRWEKTKRTLESILMQKKIDFEIVISDDGSKITNYEKIIEFFREKNFVDYVLVDNENNVGTIKNCIRGLKYSKAKYVKPIGGGDLLLGDTALYMLYKAVIAKNKKWSFGNMVCVMDTTKEKMESVAFHQGPQNLVPYEEENDEIIKYNYINCGDHISVTALLIEKETWMKYLLKISKYVKYKEDFSYELMINDGIIPTYVPANVFVYEVGEGISTSNNDKWLKILKNEDKIFYEKILKLERKKEDEEKIYLPEYNQKWTSIKPEKLYLTEEDYEQCCLEVLPELILTAKGRDIWIYGAGIAGKIMLKCLISNGIEPKGFIDINARKIKKIKNYKVVDINDIEDIHNSFLVISLMRYRKIVVEYLKENNIEDDAYMYVYAKNFITLDASL